jgi:REP element-mobilizing transposase RayT
MEIPVRKRNRLPHYDYSANGAYFITICTDKRKNTLCSIVGDGFPVPKRAGQIAEKNIQRIPLKFSGIYVDKYIIMPNHIHLLLRIDSVGGTGNPSPTIGTVVGWFKYQVTREINTICETTGKRFFQRSFHDHVVRGDADYRMIWEYIETNPMKWKLGCFYTEE